MPPVTSTWNPDGVLTKTGDDVTPVATTVPETTTGDPPMPCTENVPVKPDMVAVKPPETDTGRGLEEFTTVALPSTPYASFISW
jgi:hypothetical protein